MVRNALTYLVLYLVTLGLISFFLLRNSADQIIASSEEQLVHSAELIQLQSNKYLEELRYDIVHLSHSPFLAQFLNDPEPDSRSLLAREYLSVLNSKPHYSQIRFIEASPEGREVVRVDRSGDSTYIVSQTDLQEKGTREYFIEAAQLPPDSMYISTIDLNKEYGVISQPVTPTLRVAMPVTQNNRQAGIIVINTNVELLFNSLENITDKSTRLALLNDEGYYLYHPDDSLAFEFEFGKSSSFIDSFERRPQQISDQHPGVFSNGDNLILIRPIHYPREGYGIYLMLSADKSKLLQSYFQWRNSSFLIILTLCGFFLLLAFLILRRQAIDLKSITSRIRAFPEKPASIDIPVNRKDEIGQLASSFNEMTSLISRNIDLLEKEKARAEQAVQEKEEFLENMSHEIKNPLQSILGLTELLLRNEPQNHQLELLNSLKFNTANLQSLVNDILDYKLMLRHEIELKYEWFNLDGFVTEIIGSHAYYASAKRISLYKDVDDRLKDCQVFSDPARLSQIINNLVSNAIKYTPEGGQINIKIKALDLDIPGGSMLHIAVIDNGQGIAPELIDRIRKRYVTQNPDTPFTDSFGLGLSIVAELLDCFDSQLDIESKKGMGSTFSFKLKADMRPGTTGVTEVKTERKDILDNLRILIIDDDQQIIQLYQHILNGEQGTLYVIQDPADLTDFEQKSFDIIVSDYRLGGKKLPQVLSMVLGYLKEESPLVIVTAAHPNLKQLRKVYKDTYLIIKPFKPAQLTDDLNRFYFRTRYGQPDISSIIDDYDGQRDKYTKAIDILISELQLMSSGLQLAIRENDTDAINDIRHKMITTIRRLGLKKFEHHLANLEELIKNSDKKQLSEKVRKVLDFYIAEINNQLHVTE